MNKKVLTIIGIIIIVVVIGVGAFFAGSKLTNNKSQEEKQIGTESTTENETFNKIMSAVNEYSNENGVDVTMTAELMNELTDLYSSNPSKFNKDTVGEYLMDNGWIARGTSSGTTTYKSSEKGGQSSKISDTEIRQLIQEEWNKYNKGRNQVSIDKIEKAEEDGKGRYIYVIYWSYVDMNVQFGGYSDYLLTGADENGILREITVYGIDTTNTPENPNILSTGTSGTQSYETIQKMKNKAEFNWNK